MSRDADFRAVEKAERLARRMDSAFRVPVIGYRVGWDGILGLIPGIGDTLTLLPLAAHLRTARSLGAPSSVMGRMVANAGVDWVIGLVPLVGDLLDFGFKSHSRNAALLRAHVERRHATDAATARTASGSVPPPSASFAGGQRH